MSNSLGAPVQCSEDVSECPPANPTDQPELLTTTSNSSSFDLQHMETDAEIDRPHQPVYNAQTRDQIVLKGAGNTRIEAAGIASVLEPGGVFQASGVAQITIHKNHKPSYGEEFGKNYKNRYNITDSQEVPGIKHLDVVSSQLDKDGRRLGRAFDIDDDCLERIFIDYKDDGIQEVNYRILLTWKQNCDRPTVQKLAQMLNDIGRGDLADELRYD